MRCAPAPESSLLEDVAPDGTRVRLDRYASCSSGEVRLYEIIGGGHTWPGSPHDFDSSLGTKSRDLDASRTLAEWFLGIGG